MIVCPCSDRNTVTPKCQAFRLYFCLQNSQPSSNFSASLPPLYHVRQCPLEPLSVSKHLYPVSARNTPASSVLKEFRRHQPVPLWSSLLLRGFWFSKPNTYLPYGQYVMLAKALCDNLFSYRLLHCSDFTRISPSFSSIYTQPL